MCPCSWRALVIPNRCSIYCQNRCGWVRNSTLKIWIIWQLHLVLRAPQKRLLNPLAVHIIRESRNSWLVDYQFFLPPTIKESDGCTLKYCNFFTDAVLQQGVHVQVLPRWEGGSHRQQESCDGAHLHVVRDEAACPGGVSKLWNSIRKSKWHFSLRCRRCMPI